MFDAVGIEGAGADVVDQDAVGGKLDRQTLRQTDHGGPEGIGKEQAGDGLLDARGDDVDDASPAALLRRREVRDGRPDEPQDWPERAVQAGLPVPLRQVCELAGGRTAAVRHQDVELAEPGQGRLDQAVDGLGVGDVPGDRVNVRALDGHDLPDSLCRRGQRLGPTPVDDDPRALARQRLGAGPSQALGRGRDDGDLAGQSEFHVKSPLGAGGRRGIVARGVGLSRRTSRHAGSPHKSQFATKGKVFVTGLQTSSPGAGLLPIGAAALRKVTRGAMAG